MSVLAGFRGRHVYDLAGTTLAADWIRVVGREVKSNEPLMTTCPFLRNAEHCMGNVVDAPAPTWRKRVSERCGVRSKRKRTCSNAWLCCSSSDMLEKRRDLLDEVGGREQRNFSPPFSNISIPRDYQPLCLL